MGKFCCQGGGWGYGLRLGLWSAPCTYVYYTPPTYN